MKKLIMVFQVYDRVIKIVAPRKAKLSEAKTDLTAIRQISLLSEVEINCFISGV